MLPLTPVRATRLPGGWRGRLVILLSAIVTIGGLVSSCSNTEASPPRERVVHADGEGPLSALLLEGATLLPPPGPARWIATYGGPRLCADTSAVPGADDEGIEIENVRWDAPVPPVSVHAVLRHAVAGEGPSPGTYGSYPEFAERYAVPIPLGGEPLPDLAGQVVSQPCSTVRDSGFIELMLLVTFDRRGGSVGPLYVDYTFDAEPYTLMISYYFEACGTGITDPDAVESCRDMRNS